MRSPILTRFLVLLLLGASSSVLAFAQYGGGTTSGGTTSSSGTYTAPSGGYGSGAAIGIGVGVAAAATIAYLVLHNRATLVGCVEPSATGMKLMNEKDQRTYALESGAGRLKPGERVAVKGKKVKSKSGEPEFNVTKVTRDYGSCSVKAANRVPALAHP